MRLGLVRLVGRFIRKLWSRGCGREVQASIQAILKQMASFSILSDEFALAAAAAGFRARQKALAAGHSVVFVDDLGRYVEEMPDGRKFEIRLVPGAPRESHVVVLGELTDRID